MRSLIRPLHFRILINSRAMKMNGGGSADDTLGIDSVSGELHRILLTMKTPQVLNLRVVALQATLCLQEYYLHYDS